MSIAPVLSTIDRALVILVLTNLAAFSLFAFDKHQAREHGWRVPERHLLLVAMAGGFGAWLAQHLLRHKTRKQPFRTLLGVALALHAVVVAAIGWWLLAAPAS